MSQAGHQVDSLHSDIDKDLRIAVMNNFKAGKSRVLITTDLLARGIDVQHVSIVVNYDIPTDKEQYLHRIGRGGRFGKKGLAINFVSPEETAQFRAIEACYAVKIEELPCDFTKYI